MKVVSYDLASTNIDFRYQCDPPLRVSPEKARSLAETSEAAKSVTVGRSGSGAGSKLAISTMWPARGMRETIWIPGQVPQTRVRRHSSSPACERSLLRHSGDACVAR